MTRKSAKTARLKTLPTERNRIVLKRDFEKMSFQKAAQLFEDWGFRLQPGPRAEEITVILEGPAHRSYLVCHPEQLAEMAAVILRQRLRNHTLLSPMSYIQ
jgi:hypothetical protein